MAAVDITPQQPLRRPRTLVLLTRSIARERNDRLALEILAICRYSQPERTPALLIEYARVVEVRCARSRFGSRPADLGRPYRAGLSPASQDHHQNACILAGSTRSGGAAVRRLRAGYGLRVVK